MHRTSQGIVRFGPFEVEMGTGILRRNGIRLKLQGKPFQILEALLERPGEVVTRDELRNRLWLADTFVDFESGLNTAANRLRLALGDSAENPRYVETISRTGYRFIGNLIDDGQSAAVAPKPGSEPVSEAKRGSRSLWVLSAGVLPAASFLLLLLFFVLPALRPAAPAQPSFRQITFRQGILSNARFGPDGQTILYSAVWDAGTPRIYSANTVSPESRPLEFEGAVLASVSRSAELALLKHNSETGDYLLSRVPVNGGAPLEVVAGVSGADWSPEGKDFAVFRNTARDSVIEYPPGRVLYRSTGNVSDLRVSPNGEWLAFVEHPLKGDDAGAIRILDRKGNGRELCSNWASVGGLAWLPSGKEVWFTAARSGVRHSVFAVSLNGRLRPIATLPGMTMLYDISKEGRILIGIDRSRMLVSGSIAGEDEKDFSWFDWSHVQAVSRDGRYMLLDETGEGGGPNHSVYLRDTGTGSNVRLGDGQAVDLSPDLKWALSLENANPGSLKLLPLTPEAPRTIDGHGLEYSWARYFPDGRRLLVGGHLPGKPLRLFIQPVGGGAPVPLNPEIYLDNAVISPDGTLVAGSRNRHAVIVAAAGGDARDLATLFPAAPVQWNSDGTSLYLRDLRSRVPVRIVRFDVAHSSIRPWKELAPSDRTGLDYLMNAVVTPDGKSYAYSWLRDLSELYVVEGWS